MPLANAVRPLSPLRGRLASFPHALAIACRRRDAGGACQLVIATGDPIQPCRLIAGEIASDGRVIARIV